MSLLWYRLSTTLSSVQKNNERSDFVVVVVVAAGNVRCPLLLVVACRNCFCDKQLVIVCVVVACWFGIVGVVMDKEHINRSLKRLHDNVESMMPCTSKKYAKLLKDELESYFGSDYTERERQWKILMRSLSPGQFVCWMSLDRSDWEFWPEDDGQMLWAFHNREHAKTHRVKCVHTLVRYYAECPVYYEDSTDDSTEEKCARIEVDDMTKYKHFVEFSKPCIDLTEETKQRVRVFLEAGQWPPGILPPHAFRYSDMKFCDHGDGSGEWYTDDINMWILEIVPIEQSSSPANSVSENVLQHYLHINDYTVKSLHSLSYHEKRALIRSRAFWELPRLFNDHELREQCWKDWIDLSMHIFDDYKQMKYMDDFEQIFATLQKFFMNCETVFLKSKRILKLYFLLRLAHQLRGPKIGNPITGDGDLFLRIGDYDSPDERSTTGSWFYLSMRNNSIKNAYAHFQYKVFYGIDAIVDPVPTERDVTTASTVRMII